MKISEQTIKILQNFSSINEKLVINPGSVIRTIHKDRCLVAEAQVSETFDRQFSVDNLGKLLSVLSMSKAPEVNVSDTNIQVKGDKSSVNIRLSSLKLIKGAPDNKSIVVDYLDTFPMSQQDIKWMFNTASILGSKRVAFVGKEGKIFVEVSDNNTVDEGSLELGTTAHSFKAVLLVENMLMMTGDYDVSVSSRGVVQFAAKNLRLKYWIAIEKESSQFE